LCVCAVQAHHGSDGSWLSQSASPVARSLPWPAQHGNRD
jgi:hypothetical protein